MPQAAKETLAQLGRVVAQLDAQLAEVDDVSARDRSTRDIRKSVAPVAGMLPVASIATTGQFTVLLRPWTRVPVDLVRAANNRSGAVASCVEIGCGGVSNATRYRVRLPSQCIEE